MKIGIIGYGVVGKSLEYIFKDECSIRISDPKYISVSIADLNGSDIIFVCVPTPYNVENNEFDDDCINSVFNQLEKLPNQNIPIVIKSAITPKKVLSLINKYKSLDIMVSPEFLTDRNSVKDMIHSPVMIIGGNNNKSKEFVKWVFTDYSIINPNCKYGFCSSVQGAFIKYMENSWLATMNIFYNQFKMYYDKFNSVESDHEFNDLLEVFHLDPRVGSGSLYSKSYTVPGPDGHLGYGGKCLPKDVKSIVSDAKTFDTNLSLLESVDNINEEIRGFKDWLTINGAMS